MQMLPFQENAVLGANGLVETFKKLWQTGASHLNITFKSPTGSGKTFMVSNFLRELQNDPGFDSDVAFVWITFSDELAMQSRDKFVDTFSRISDENSGQSPIFRKAFCRGTTFSF